MSAGPPVKPRRCRRPRIRLRPSRPPFHVFVEFCAADFARYQLLFQRTIPGFEPTPESFKISQDSLAELGELLARCGVRSPEMFYEHITKSGGEYISGENGEHITIDAIEFCGTLSGRATGTSLLTQDVPF